MKKVNNQGFSLLELILAMAIAFFLLATITILISTTSNSFSYQETETSIQTEAQIIMSQLSNMVMNSNNVKNESIVGKSVVCIYNTDGTNKYPRMEVWHDNTTKQLFVNVVETPEQDINYAPDWNLLGEYVEEFSFTDTVDDTKGDITFRIVLKTKVNKRDYQCEQESTVSLRNRIVPLPTPSPTT